MKKKYSSIVNSYVDPRQMIEGGCLGMLVALPFFFIFIIIFGVGDRALSYARHIIPFGGLTGAFGGYVKALAKRKRLIFACVFSSVITLLVTILFFVQK